MKFTAFRMQRSAAQMQSRASLTMRARRPPATSQLLQLMREPESATKFTSRQLTLRDLPSFSGTSSVVACAGYRLLVINCNSVSVTVRARVKGLLFSLRKLSGRASTIFCRILHLTRNTLYVYVTVTVTVYVDT